jgi:Flp pilus assembly protein TadG
MFAGYRKRDRRRTEKGTSLLVGVTALVFIIPMVGLSIDTGIIYAVRAKLQGAVDGAALAAARALNLGQDVTTETASAQSNAALWFSANFPTGTWSTTGTSLGTVNVNFTPTINGTSVPNLIQISIAATTNVPTYFMKWLHFDSTLVGATGQTTRRDINAMLVLDRSSSMNTTGSCPSLIQAAQIFTGDFVDTRDKIGAISFSDGTYLHSEPGTGFQEKLGYIDTGGTAHNGTAAAGLNNIVCSGGTGTAQAITLAYNELYKKAQPGAFNVIVLETDGLPNTLTLNFLGGKFGSAPQTIWHGLANRAGTGCLDAGATNRTVAGGGWTNTSNMRNWTSGFSMNTNQAGSAVTGFTSDIPSGMIGSIYSQDPGGTTFGVLANPWHTSANYGLFTNILTGGSGGATPGCNDGAGNNWGRTSGVNDMPDFAWLPATDVYGNALNPSTNAYKSVTNVTVSANGTNHTEVAWGALSTASTPSRWTQYHNAALNAADSAGYNARAGTNMSGSPFQVTIYVIGLGGNTAYVPDYILLQRIANDPNKDQDTTHSPLLWQDCSTEATCVNYASTVQPQGQFIWADTKSDLATAFQKIASQVLRISK